MVRLRCAESLVGSGYSRCAWTMQRWMAASRAESCCATAGAAKAATEEPSTRVAMSLVPGVMLTSLECDVAHCDALPILSRRKVSPVLSLRADGIALWCNSQGDADAVIIPAATGQAWQWHAAHARSHDQARKRRLAPNGAQGHHPGGPAANAVCNAQESGSGREPDYTADLGGGGRLRRVWWTAITSPGSKALPLLRGQRSLGRNGEAERGTAIGVVFRPQPPAMRLDNGAADGEPHAETAALGGVEWLKDP